LITYETDAEDREVPELLDNFAAIDKKICSPRFMSTTMHRVPPNRDILKKVGIPFAVRVQPLAAQRIDAGERPLQTVDFGEDGPLRCGRCRAYINPFVKFVEYGRKWRCNICKLENEVPRGYQCNVDTYGHRRDVEERPELNRGSVEFLVGKAMRGGVQREPIYVFAIDVSLRSVSNGLLSVVVKTLQALLPALPAKDRTRVGIVTFDSSLHFYDVSGEEIKEHVVADANDVFCPLPLDSWLPRLSAHRVDSLLLVLKHISETYNEKTVSDVSNVGSASVKAVFDGLSDAGGNLLLFTSSISGCGEGRLKSRETQASYASDNERTLYCPIDADKTNGFYDELAVQCASKQVCVNIFVASSFYVDVSTLGVLSRSTGGDLRLYRDFKGSCASDCQKLYGDVRRTLTRESGYEAVMKIRCGAGIRIKTNGFYGQFFRKTEGSEEMYFAGIDSDKELVVELEHDGVKLCVGQNVHLQSALLYTRKDGQRVIRVHNLALKIIDHLPTIFRHASIGCVMSYITKRAARDAFKRPLKEVRGSVFETCISVLFSYRKYVATRSAAGQLILPESLKLVAVYVNTLLKSDALSVNKKADGPTRVRADQRAFALIQNLTASTSVLLGRLYPRLHVLYPIDDAADASEKDSSKMDTNVVVPKSTWSSSEKLELDGVFLIQDAERIMIHFGDDVSRETATLLLGKFANALHSDPKSVVLTPQQNDLSARVMKIIEKLQAMWEFYGQTCPVYVMNGALKTEFTSKLVEDKTFRSDTSYIDFLCALHKKIQSRMK